MKKVTPQFAVKGCLTRLALWFSGQRRSFTGEQVAEILIASWLGYERDVPASRLEEGQSLEGKQP